RAKDPLLPLFRSELPLIVADDARIDAFAVVENAADHCLVIIMPDAFDEREFLLASHARRANEHYAIHVLRMSGGVLDGDLAAQAAGDQVIRRILHECIQIRFKLIGEKSDGDWQSLVNAAMKHGAVVDKQLRYLDIEVPLPGAAVAVPCHGLLRKSVDKHQRFQARKGLRAQET